MTASRVAVGAASVAVLAWGLKGLAIAVAGGLDESPLEGPLYLLGLVSILTAAAALGVAAAGEHGAATRIASALAVAVGATALSLAIQEAVRLALPEDAGWVQGEAGLWISATLVLAVSIWRLREVEREPLSST